MMDGKEKIKRIKMALEVINDEETKSVSSFFQNEIETLNKEILNETEFGNLICASNKNSIKKLTKEKSDYK